MIVKILVLVVAGFVQVAFSQEQQQQQQPSGFVGYGMTAAQMWNPSTWSTPYLAAASQAWTDYLKKAQEASNQLYKQWDVTGAGNLFNTGMQLAQQTGQSAAEKTEQAAQAAMDKANEGAKEAVNQAKQGAETAANQAQQLLPKA